MIGDYQYAHVCEQCGREYESPSRWKRFCPECVGKRNRAGKEKHYAKVAERRRLKRLEIRTKPCKRCGREFKIERKHARYCAKCRKIVKREGNTRRMREKRAREKQERGDTIYFRNCRQCGRTFKIKPGANNTLDCPACKDTVKAICERCGIKYRKSRYATQRKLCDECRGAAKGEYVHAHQRDMKAADDVLKEFLKKNLRPPKSVSARAAAIQLIRAGVPVEQIPAPAQLVAEAHQSYCEDNPAQFLNQEQREQFRSYCEKHKMGV